MALVGVTPTGNNGPVRFPLPPTFRFVHDPLADATAAIPLLGHGEVIEDLATQLRYSDSGTFLITGFRGVGKTTVVRRAIEQARRDTAGERHVVHVDLNVARPLSTGELLFAVIRRLFEQLVEDDLLDGLTEAAQRTLILAYTRTSLQLAHKRSESSERGGSLGASGSGVLTAVLGSLLPKLELTAKRTSALAVEASFLTYSDTDVEHDFVRIVRELRRSPHPKQSFWRRARRDSRTVQLVVVVDELDKLTAGRGGVEAFEELLLGLKNVLTAGGAHFVFVAGPDVHALAASDRVRGSGIYESVFAWQAYVPCLWDAPAVLVEQILDLRAPLPAPLPAVLGFLRYRSRGILRRLLQEFNGLVEWDGADPMLVVGRADQQRAQFFDRMRVIIDGHLGVENASARTTMEEDRRRLASYFVLDWILSSDGRVFEAGDIVGETPTDAITDASLPLELHGVDLLLGDLSEAGVLIKREPDNPSITIITSARSSLVATYHLTEETLAEVRSLSGLGARTLVPAGTDRRLRAQPWASGAPVLPPVTEPPYAPMWPPAPTWVPPTSATTIGPPPSPAPPSERGEHLPHGFTGDLILGRLLGAGAMGSVYEAEDTRLGRKVAIKLIERQSAVGDPDLRSRFDREVTIATGLSHPGLVRTLGRIDDGGRMGLVMDLIAGPTLADVPRPVEAATVVRWGVLLCEALQYLADQGIARIDLKPPNIIITNDRPVIVDLGLAKSVLPTSGYTTLGGLVGTPAYMAPEQLDGQAPPDIRTDLYSLGIVLFELLGGHELRPPLDNIPAILTRTATEEVPVDQLAVSADLQTVLRRATARDPDARYSEPRLMATELSAVPEAAEGKPVGT